MGFENLKQRLAVILALKQTSAAVDRMIEAHSCKNKDSPLFDVFPYPRPQGCSSEEDERAAIQRLNARTLLLLYSVEGLLDEATGDSALFVLDRTTAAEFQAHIALERPLTLVAVTASSSVVSCAVQSAKAVGTVDEGTVRVEEVVSSIEDALDITRVDVNPSSACMSTVKAGMTILTRPTEALARAESILNALEHGSARADAECAVTDCCVWLQDTIALIDAHFESLVSHSDTALQVVEAFMKRYSMMKQLQGVVTSPSGVFARMEAFLSPTGEAALQYRQRLAQLMLVVLQLRVDAMWASLLTSISLRLKLASPVASQSLAGITDLARPLIRLVAIVFAAAGSCGNDGSAHTECSRSHPLLMTLKQKFLPLVARNVLQKCGDYLSLGTIFSVGSVPDADEVQGYVMPLCTRPAIAVRLDNVSELALDVSFQLHRFGRALEKHFPSPSYVTFRSVSLQSALCETDADNSAEDIVASTLHYAANRCGELRTIIRHIDTAGCGMMTKEVRCLFDTVHNAANAFDMLDGLQYKNWQLFADVFEKTRVIKYTSVEPVSYGNYSEIAAVVPRLSASNASVQPSRSGDDVDEEKRILRARVAVLSSELTAARELLSLSTASLQQTQRGLQQAQELNEVLMNELRKVMVERGHEDGSHTRMSYYEALIQSLADDSITGA